MIHKKAMLGEADHEALSLAEDIMRRLIEAKMAAMLDRVNKIKNLIFKLLRSNDTKTDDENYKYNFYSSLQEENGEPIAIDDTQLDEFMQWICTGVIANRCQKLKIDFSKIKEKLWNNINEFFEMGK